MFYFKINLGKNGRVLQNLYSRKDGCDVNPHPLLFTNVLQVCTFYNYPSIQNINIHAFNCWNLGM